MTPRVSEQPEGIAALSVAETIMSGVTMWLTIGSVVAVAFLSFGVSRIDEDAREAIGFRPLLIPGILVLWPLVAWRWAVLATGRAGWRGRYNPPRRAHSVVAVVLAVVLALSLVISYVLRQSWPDHIAPERLSPPGTSQS